MTLSLLPEDNAILAVAEMTCQLPSVPPMTLFPPEKNRARVQLPKSVVQWHLPDIVPCTVLPVGLDPMPLIIARLGCGPDLATDQL
jgi:hypothetical protein